MRIRTIKPDFWLHEGLAELSPLHRLLFIGLWMLADKAGRLEDRPKRIAAALFPYDQTADVDRMLADLDEAGHVQRYDGFLAIPGFAEHQRPHPKEAASTIPAPPSREKKRLAVEFPEACASFPSTPVGREGKGREGKGTDPAGKPAGLELPGLEPPKPPKPEKPPDHRHAPLVKALVEVYRYVTRGSRYAFTGRDAKAVSDLLALSPDDEEILFKWRTALERAENQFQTPKTRTIPELVRDWNHYTAIKTEAQEAAP